MKTTLDLPDHLILQVKIRATKEKKRMREVIAEILEEGLKEIPERSRDKIIVKPFFKKTFTEEGVINFNHLADELGDEETLMKMAR